MKVIKSVLFIILSAIVLGLVWIFFNWIISFMMNLSWFWLVVVFIIGATFLIPLISVLPGILAYFVSNLRYGSIVETIIIILVAAYFLFSSIASPWVQGASDNFKWIITALFHNSLAIGVFWSITASLLAKEKY